VFISCMAAFVASAQTQYLMSATQMSLRLVLLATLILLVPLQVFAQGDNVDRQDLMGLLETVFELEQLPIRMRDSLMAIHGVDHEQVKTYQRLYEENHAENEKTIRTLLDSQGWPNRSEVGERGHWIIANVLQHSSNEVRIMYLPMMREEVEEGNLNPRFLARAEDRIATERGDLQVYGGQMKYYPETQTFNVWPVLDPENIDVRRAAIGLGPIADHLRERFDFEWDLKEQIRRTREFEQSGKNER